MKLNADMFNLSKAKQPELDSSTQQLSGKAVNETLIKRIGNGSVAAIGFVNQNDMLWYLFNP